RICGFLINKFRGDESLLRPGVTMMEHRLDLPCVGIVPYLPDLGLDEEDGVALEDRASTRRRWKNLENGPERPLRVGVIALPHMANFTDFDTLALEPSVSLAFLEQPEEMAIADLLILPGSKQTLDDLEWLDCHGFSQELRRLCEKETALMGICGGLQMLGSLIEDPHGIENQGKPRTRTGLGCLPARTILHTEKTVRRVRGCVRSKFLGQSLCPETHFQGYEIHVGETVYENGAEPFAEIVREGIPGFVPDGAVCASGRVLGTYVHGLFDKDDFRHSFLAALRIDVGLAPAETWANVTAERGGRIDCLADHLRRSLDMNRIRSWITAPSKR
ncbi:MAG TPA: cobyric acid synthase, partial [Candidatus Binatia bacterium]|nr:cobyric acid synthase [Candidatus Binatia bacterium]